MNQVTEASRKLSSN